MAGRTKGRPLTHASAAGPGRRPGECAASAWPDRRSRRSRRSAAPRSARGGSRCRYRTALAKQLAGLAHGPLAGRGGVGRTGKREHRALANAIDQDRRADRRVGAHRPATALSRLAPRRLEQLADGHGGGGPIDGRRAVDKERPVRARNSPPIAAGLASRASRCCAESLDRVRHPWPKSGPNCRACRGGPDRSAPIRSASADLPERLAQRSNSPLWPVTINPPPCLT